MGSAAKMTESYGHLLVGSLAETVSWSCVYGFSVWRRLLTAWRRSSQSILRGVFHEAQVQAVRLSVTLEGLFSFLPHSVGQVRT